MTMNKTLQQIVDAAPAPEEKDMIRSRERVMAWFADQAEIVSWDVIASPVGDMYIACNNRGVCAISFGKTKADFFEEIDPLARTIRKPDAVASVATQIRRYFTDDHKDFDLPVDLSAVTEFQRDVLEVVQHIPPGEVLTYKQVAERVGNPRASRAVGNAVARNPIPIIVPCHRVVPTGGGLGKYSGGRGAVDKQYLLHLEGAPI